MPFQIVRNDITRVAADVIVNTANPYPRIGRGTDSAIYQAAGIEQLMKARKEIGIIPRGQAVATPAFNLHAKYIIHTVGPSWRDGQQGEEDTLRDCYRNSLALASNLGARSIAFPLISSGSYGFPKEKALQIALDEISAFLMIHEIQVFLVVFDRHAVRLSRQLVGAIDEYIDEHLVKTIWNSEYAGHHGRGRWSPDHERRREREDLTEVPLHSEPAELSAPSYGNIFGSFQAISQPESIEEQEYADSTFSAANKTLDEMLGDSGETFQQRLLHLIDKSGMDDVTVYKKANLDRKLFSKIRCKPDYKPKKQTAIAFAIALELDMDAMQDLLSRAEIALSPSSKFDLIITYFVTNRIYDIFQINAALFQYGQPTLGTA